MGVPNSPLWQLPPRQQFPRAPARQGRCLPSEARSWQRHQRKRIGPFGASTQRNRPTHGLAFSNGLTARVLRGCPVPLHVRTRQPPSQPEAGRWGFSQGSVAGPLRARCHSSVSAPQRSWLGPMAPGLGVTGADCPASHTACFRLTQEVSSTWGESARTVNVRSVGRPGLYGCTSRYTPDLPLAAGRPMKRQLECLASARGADSTEEQ